MSAAIVDTKNTTSSLSSSSLHFEFDTVFEMVSVVVVFNGAADMTMMMVVAVVMFDGRILDFLI